MSKFKITDLMVSLDATKAVNHTFCLNATGCHAHTPFCYHYTCGVSIDCNIGCSLRPTLCFAGTCPGGSILCRIGSCGISEEPTWRETSIIQQYIPSLDIRELAELKVALQGLVEKIDKEFQPAKLEQMNALEGQLNEALEDLQEQKKKFS